MRVATSHAQDVAAGILLVATRGALQAETYNLASGVETSIRELAERLRASLDVRANIGFDGLPGSSVPVRWCADISKIAGLGYAPSVPLADGLERVAAWWRRERARSSLRR